MASMKSLLSDTVLYGLSSIIARLLNFALTPLLTVVLSKSEYGVNALLYVSIAFLMVILTYGFETAYFRISEKNSNEEHRVYSTAMWSLIVSTIIFLIIFSIYYIPISELIHMSNRPYLVLWMAWIVAMDAISAVPFARLRAQRRAKRFIFIKISQIAVNFILCYSIFLILPNLGYELPDWQVGWVLFANLIASGFMIILLLPEFFAVKMIFDFGIWKTMMVFGLPLLLAGLPGIANEMADRFFIEYLMPVSSSKQEVGTYSAIYKLSIFIILFNQAFRYAAEPFFFKESENKKQQLAEVLRLFTGILCIGMVSVLAGLDGIKFFIDSKYWEALPLLYILLLSNVFLSMNTQISMWYKLSDKTYMGFYITIVGLAITVIGNFTLIPIIGIDGAAWTTLVSYMAMTIISIILGQLSYKIPYDFKKIFLYLISASILGWIASENMSNYFYSFGAMFIMISIVLFSERKFLMRSVK
jgi:O-antigen/teichoic acid export membrane protein|tara:strand:+ start:23605 stop:25023 length:1419 start_codon:yes stop_codon:yes gene_type:complete